jgi:UDP-glucose 4-epimerase
MLAHGHKEPSRAARVVILGARGFVARALAAGLAADGIAVLAIGSSTLNLSDPSAVLRLTDTIQDGDVLVMAAALTPEKGRDAATMIRNIRMAEHVAVVIKSRPFSQLVYFSSDAVYGGQATSIDEDFPAAPADLYGLMHRAREIALGEAATSAGVPFCVLRPCAIYGPGDTHNSYGPNRFIRTSLKEGKIQIFGLGEETRDHVYIGDVVSLTKLCIAHASAGMLNVVSGQTISFGSLADRIAQMTGGNSKIESLPRKGAVTHRSFDSSLIKRSFPGHMPTPLEAGLSRTVDAFSRGE